MSIPSTLAGHIKHCFPAGPQRDALVRLAEAVDLLNQRCACVNTIGVPEVASTPLVISEPVEEVVSDLDLGDLDVETDL